MRKYILAARLNWRRRLLGTKLIKVYLDVLTLLEFLTFPWILDKDPNLIVYFSVFFDLLHTNEKENES